MRHRRKDGHSPCAIGFNALTPRRTWKGSSAKIRQESSCSAIMSILCRLRHDDWVRRSTAARELLPYRLQLLHAMEVFAVAHEHAHFISEERIPQFTGSLDPSQSQQLEFFCDELGLAISRECESARNNYLLFAGVGALVFFRAIQVCESVRELLVNSGTQGCANRKRQTPILSRERIVAIKSQVLHKTAPISDASEAVYRGIRHNSGWARFRGGRCRQLRVSSETVTGPNWSCSLRNQNLPEQSAVRDRSATSADHSFIAQTMRLVAYFRNPAPYGTIRCLLFAEVT